MQNSVSDIITDISTLSMNLIFPIILLTLLVVSMIDFAKFFLTKKGIDVLKAVIASASAITLIGLHKGTDILLRTNPQTSINTQNSLSVSSPINDSNYLLFIFVIAGGLFVLITLIADKWLGEKEDKKEKEEPTTSSDVNKNNKKWYEIIDGIIQGPWLTRVCAYILLVATVVIVIYVGIINVFFKHL